MIISMSATGKFIATLLASVFLVLCSTAVQVSISQAEEQSIAAGEAASAERAAAAARWESAVSYARRGAEPVAASARAAATSAGTLATAEDVAALEKAVAVLDDALEGRDIGAIAAARTRLASAHAVFLEAVGVTAESLLPANGSADQAAKDAVSTAVTRLRSAVADDVDTEAALLELRSAADRVVASHQANVAAAAAAAAAARSTEATDDGSGASLPIAPGPVEHWVVTHPIPIIEAFGDYRPGCEVIIGEWTWWYEDPPGYVAVDPGYPYDIEVMEFEGRYAGVKSLPCVV
jgi:hypothetical protein